MNSLLNLSSSASGEAASALHSLQGKSRPKSPDKPQGFQGFLDLLRSKLQDPHSAGKKTEAANPQQIRQTPDNSSGEKLLRKAHPTQNPKVEHLVPRFQAQAQDLAEEKLKSGEIAALLIQTPIREQVLKTSPAAKGSEGEIRVQAKERRPGQKPAGEVELPTSPLDGPEVPKNQKKRPAEEAKFQVIDRRTETKDKPKAVETWEDKNSPAPIEVRLSPKGPEIKPGDEVKIQTITPKAQEMNSNPLNPTPTTREAAPLLASYLQEKGNLELVSQAKIILKDQNAGEIRMTLYPEHLGKVRLNLTMEEGSLVGQIFVENNTVKEVFQGNLDNLAQSFKDAGYQNLSLQVSVQGQRQGQAQNQGEKTYSFSVPGVDGAGEKLARSEGITYTSGSGLVDLRA